MMTDDELNEIEARQCAGDVPALVAEVRRLRASPPAWHDRPTGPGLWYKANGGTVSVIDCDMGTYIINNWPGGRVFGPIPADEGAQA